MKVADPCAWRGVGARDGRVTTLDLSGCSTRSLAAYSGELALLDLEYKALPSVPRALATPSPPALPLGANRDVSKPARARGTSANIADV